MHTYVCHRNLYQSVCVREGGERVGEKGREGDSVRELYSPRELLWSYFNNSQCVGLCTMGL